MADAPKTFISLATGPDDPDLPALRELDALFNGHDILATEAHLDMVLRKATADLEDGEAKWIRESIQETSTTNGLRPAIEQAFYAAIWEPEPPSPPVVCDACGTSFDTFRPGQAYGCDSGLTSDRTGFGGAYGSKHDCAYYTVADPATFPGNNVCDVCIDAMLADGRLVDGQHVNLATDEEMAEFFHEPDLFRDVAEVLEMAVEELRSSPGVPFVTGATSDTEFSVQITVHRNDEDTETPEQESERFHQELRDAHARFVAAGGPTQRMLDALALYKRTVKSSLDNGPDQAFVDAFQAVRGTAPADLPIGDDEDDDLPTPIASYDAYVLSHRFKDVMAECETGGNLHNLVSSANVEDDDVAYLTDKAQTPAEKACIELAAQLSPGERWAAWLIANGREAEARGRGFAAQDLPSMAASELRAFIDSLDDDT